MKKLLMLFFLITLCSCASKPERPIPFDGKWTMIEIAPEKMSGCLSAEDMVKFREYQYACEEKKVNSCEW